MTPHTEELKRLAQKATPGPWAQRVGYGSVWSGALEALGIRVCVCDADDYDGDDDEEAKAQAKATATYIAAANPQAILALIERLETLEEAVKGAHAIAEQAGEVLRANKGTVRLTLEQAHSSEFVGPYSQCPACGEQVHHAENNPYKPDCWLAAAIKEAGADRREVERSQV